MAFNAGNKLVPILAVGLVLVALMVLLGGRAEEPGGTQLSHIPAAPPPDHDSSVETMRAMTAELKSLQAVAMAVMEETARLRRSEAEREARVKALQDQMKTMKDSGRTASSADIERLERQLRELRDQQRRAPNASTSAPYIPPERSQPEPSTPAPAFHGIGSVAEAAKPFMQIPVPIGRGSDLNGIGITPGAQPRHITPRPDSSMIWHKPLELGGGTEEQKGRTGIAMPTSTTLAQAVGQASAADVAGAKADKAPTVIPRYTIPAWSTLLDATAMTALVGRIPINGTVEDPFPIKIIVSGENLAANGHEIPGLQGMILAGQATGDWNLSCVRGRILGATFVFEDGSIISYPQNNTAGGGGSASVSPPGVQGGQGANVGLGQLSDEFGNPCISGRRITNAPSYLAGRTGLAALGAAGEAVANAQSTTVIGADSAQRFFSGDTGKFVAGSTVVSATEEINKWLTERQARSFDVVYARPGVRVGVHIEKEIWIDLDTQGRKLSYHVAEAAHVRSTLD